MSKVMLIGGAGFIGSYIAKELIDKGHDVVVYDYYINYLDQIDNNYQKYLGLRFKETKDKVTFVRGNVQDVSYLRRTLLEHKPERVIYLAGLPMADLADKHSEETINSTLQGTVNVLETIRDLDFVKRFVYTSSSMVYGDFKYEPADEEHPTNPKNIYGATKLAGEILVKTYGSRFNIDYTIIRPSAVYGPTDVNRRVSQIFIENAIKGKKLILHNNGNAKLDFSYVKDVAKGFVLATFSEKARNETFNITRGEGRSLKEFVGILEKHFDNMEIEYQAENPRPVRGGLDIKKAKKLLGYNPEYSLEKGLDEYIPFVKEHIKP